jgi:hypothetical protein
LAVGCRREFQNPQRDFVNNIAIAALSPLPSLFTVAFYRRFLPSLQHLRNFRNCSLRSRSLYSRSLCSRTVAFAAAALAAVSFAAVAYAAVACAIVACSRISIAIIMPVVNKRETCISITVELVVGI